MVISAVLPVLQLQWFTLFSNSSNTIHLFNIINGIGENEVAVTGSSEGLNAQQITLFAAAIISFCLLSIQCLRIAKVQRLKKRYPVQKLSEFDFVNTDISSAPFSFLKNVFWRTDIDLNDETGRQILQHEITHVQQKHSWDKLFMQFVISFYWMNPFFYLIKNELYLIHEFIADENAVKHSDADAFAKMLLTAQFGKFNFLPAQSIFYSSIKRRLIMLTTSKKPQFSYARRLMVLPLVATLVCLFAFTIRKDNSSLSAQKTVAAKPFVLVVDAGHGGTDNGAVGNGLREKDVALKIAEKIKSLSTAYNIDVILTRSSDVFMSPLEKSNFANTQNADAFISIHINADKSQPAQSGFGVFISTKNQKLSKTNQVLGSAIMVSIIDNSKTGVSLQTKKSGIWVLDNSNIPSAIIECGYITNKGDAEILKDDAKMELMAKNILQGVAMYANNSLDESQLLQLQQEYKDTTPSKTNTSSQPPLYIIDGKISSKEKADAIDPNSIESVNVLKDKNATGKYGDKGKNGVVEITLKPNASNTKSTSSNALYILDGQIVSKEKADALDPNSIESVTVLKDKDATDKYGDKGKNGVVEITLKK